MDNTIIFISGVSGSGKGTLLDKILVHYKNFEKVKSYTSRPIRVEETENSIYNFVTNQEFKDAVAQDEFLEYALVHQKYYYGTKIQDVKNTIDSGKVPIKEIDINGLEQLKIAHTTKFKYFSLFLEVSEEIMKQRINTRGAMSDEELQRRLNSAHEEKLKARKLCNFVVDASGTKEEVFETVSKILDKYFIQ